MSFIPKTFGGLAYGLIDALGIGKKAQSLVDKTGVNGRWQRLAGATTIR